MSAMTNLTEISDETLLRRSAAGDEAAFVALYRRQQTPIYRFALHMSGSAAVAEEVTQDVFMNVMRDGKRFDENRGTAKSYLFGVARNCVRKVLERNRAYVGLEDEDALEQAIPASPEDLLTVLARAEAVENVRQAVLELPAVYREAIALCDLEEMSYADAAATIGVPMGTVRSRIARGRALLLQKLSKPGAQGARTLRCFA